MRQDLDLVPDPTTARASRGSANEDATSPGSARAALICAAIVILVLQRFVPFGRLILYPFTLLSTWVHEMGHGVTALLCGGQFARLDIFADASGMAHSAVLPGFRQALVAAGGLIAPSFVGALLLLLARRAARPVLFLLGGALLASLLLWVRTPVGWLTVGGLGLLFLTLARFGGPDLRLFFAQLVGLLLALDTVTRLDYFFVASGQVGGSQHPSDVAGIATVMGGPYQFWGGLCAGLSLLFVAVGIVAVLRSRPAPAAV